MWDREIRAMVSTHAIMAASVFMATVGPAIFLPGFSVYGTHLSWLYSVSAAVTVVSVAAFWLLGVGQPTRKHSLGYKVRLFRMYIRDNNIDASRAEIKYDVRKYWDTSGICITGRCNFLKELARKQC